MKTLELYLDGDFEGVFDSTKEIASYLRIPKRVATLLLSADYESIGAGYYHISIYDVTSSEVMKLPQETYFEMVDRLNREFDSAIAAELAEKRIDDQRIAV